MKLSISVGQKKRESEKKGAPAVIRDPRVKG